MKGILAAVAVVASLCAGIVDAHAQVTLQNDGFESGQALGAQGGFDPGEIGASRFVAPGPGRTLQSVLLFFGGASGTRTVTLHVWDDTAGTNAPGAELFSADFDLTGSDQNLSSIDVSAMNIIVPQQFRVGIELQTAGLPSLARDVDNSIAQDRNYLFGNVGLGLQWYRSSDLGLLGDWILRAVVSGSAGGPDGGYRRPRRRYRRPRRRYRRPRRRHRRPRRRDRRTRRGHRRHLQRQRGVSARSVLRHAAAHLHVRVPHGG
jgi:hypothetical protein